MSRGRNRRSAWPKIGMTPQRCFLSPITSRATASIQADLPTQQKFPLCYPWTHEHHRTERETPPGNQSQKA